VLVAVLADTHLHDGIARHLSPAALGLLATADVVLHAGDVTGPATLADLCARVRTHAVLGNNDRELVGLLPDTATVEIEGLRISIVHDAGGRDGRARRLGTAFPTADLVVFGHSHEPTDEVGCDGQILFNPGSPTRRRRQPHHTMGRLEIIDGVLVDRAIVVV
jgi:putative phosphoesterase